MKFYALAGMISRVEKTRDHFVVAAFAAPASSREEAMRYGEERFAKDFPVTDGWEIEVNAFEIPYLALKAYADYTRGEAA